MAARQTDEPSDGTGAGGDAPKRPKRKKPAKPAKSLPALDGGASAAEDAKRTQSGREVHLEGVEKGAAIPPHYDEDRLGVVVRDSSWLYCYWEIEGGACQRIIDAQGQKYLDAADWVLRVRQDSDVMYDVDVDPSARSWYVHVSPQSQYRIEFGVVGGEGHFHLIAEAPPVETPPVVAGQSEGGKWFGDQGELERLMEFVGGGSSMMSFGSRGFSRTLRARPKPRPVDGSSEDELDLPNGYLMLVLHAHLPYVRHPEYERFLEEDWLFEAITETYVPLADMFTRLAEEGVRARAAVSLSPTLCEMMSDPLLQRRYSGHLDRLIDCAEAALEKMRGTAFQSAAEMYVEKLHRIRTIYYSWDRNLIHAFRALKDRGVLDVLTSGATHGILPLMARPGSVRAQVEFACRNHEKHFGRRPTGIWLPECAYAPGLDAVLSDCGIEYFFVDSHGLLNATPRPSSLSYRPTPTPAGTTAIARDPETGILVWSAEHGFPGDPIYREFYRDLGHDGDYEMIRPCLHPDGMRRNIGLKYHRVTGRVPLERKEPYVPDWARKCTFAHADYFVTNNETRVDYLRQMMDLRPVVCAMYDAELFGHWWYEGVDFLENVLRRAARDGSSIESTTPPEYLAAETSSEMAEPSASSWGDKGYYEQWLNGANDWIYPHLHKAEERMQELAEDFSDAEGLTERALNQAARELLLAQSSDWAFLMTTGTATPYAIRRTRDHVAQFTRLYEMIVAGEIDEDDLEGLEGRDAIFSEMDFRVFAPE